MWKPEYPINNQGIIKHQALVSIINIWLNIIKIVCIKSNKSNPIALFPGPKARGKGIKAGERHPGGEGECQPAEPAAGGLQQGELLPEQPGAH